MHRFASRTRSALLAGAMIAAIGLAASSPADASAPPGNGPVVVNSSGAAVTVWYAQTGNTFTAYASSSPDQVAWTTPVTLGQGVEPAAALSPGNVAVAVWHALSEPSSLGIDASARTPGGTWSAPVNVAPTGQAPRIGIDSAGDAVATWLSTSYGVQAATLPAGRSWSTPFSFGTITDATPAIAVAPNGSILVAWGPPDGYVQASLGSITGSWSTPVNISLKLYHMRGPRVTLNSSGQGSASWSSNDGVPQTVTLSNGVWSTP